MAVTQTIIPRATVVAGARDDTFSVKDATAAIVRREVVIANADILTLNATPVSLVPAPSADCRIAILGVHSSKAAGAYSGGAAADIRYTSTGNPVFATLPAAHFRASGADPRWSTPAAITGLPADYDVPEGGVEISVGTAFTGAGGGVVTITVVYFEIRG